MGPRDAVAAHTPRDAVVPHWRQCAPFCLRVASSPAVFISRGLSEVRTARFTTWIHDATFLLIRMCMFVLAALMWKWT